MRMYDIIKKKRDGGQLNKEEIDFFIRGYVRGEIPDYQVSALLMAIFYEGMSDEETLNLTLAVRDSGETLNVDVGGVRADKHSTGGVGDKTSLVVMPIVASCGVKVFKMSGRGLGHTGGTVDKLESIEGLNTGLDFDKFVSVAKDVGLSIVGQSKRLAPADKLLYALRDVTATVDSIPLIVSSIMGKKLAANDDVIVLDVKSGSGAFMKTEEDSVKLARLCVDIAKRAGKKASALVTDMSSPLGNAIGNSLEVVEAIEALNGRGPSDLMELSLALAAEILFLSGKGERSECEALAKDAIKSGKALKVFAAMVKAQGGNERYVYEPQLFERAKFSLDVCAQKDGYITEVDAEGYGRASLLLKAGRNVMTDKIDFSAGIVLSKKRGDVVRKGDIIATLYYNGGEPEAAKTAILESTFIGDEKPEAKPLIIRRVV